MFVAALLVASALGGIDAAAAEAVPQYACVLDQITAADRRAYGPPSPDGAALTAVSARVDAYAAACAARYGWDQARQRLAGTYSLAAIARDGLRAHLAANRIDVGVIDGWAESYSDWSDAMDNEDVGILYARLVNAGATHDRLSRFTGEISDYLAVRETIAAIRLGRPFPGQPE